jgi:hypothetical protein
VPNYNYHVFWNHKSGIGEKINKLTKQDESILIYPHDVDLYPLSKRFPPDRFTYWFPWINSVDAYHLERQKAMEDNPPAVIYIGNMDFKNIKNYYEQYFPEITNGYTRIYTDNKGDKEGVWLRNDLLSRVK